MRDIARVTDAIRRASELYRDLGAVLSPHADSLAFHGDPEGARSVTGRVGEEAI